MKVIVGLGNPGKKYEHTRHNIGFLVVDALLEEWDAKLKLKKANYKACSLTVDDESLIVAKPSTYMNESGKAVKEMMHHHFIKLSELLIVVDDINLPLGKIRYRLQGSAGGHNGLKSIIAQLDTEAFPRLRIGVGAPSSKGNSGSCDSELANYVLSPFEKREQGVLKRSIAIAVEACQNWLRLTPQELMAKYNVNLY